MANSRKDTEFLKYVFNRLAQVPIERVMCEPLKKGMPPLLEGIRYGTNHIEALNPFRRDETPGSFKITPAKQMWWDFAEHYGGDKIAFYACWLFKNPAKPLTNEYLAYLRKHYYVDAAIRLAYDISIITKREYDKYSKVQYDASVQNMYRERYEKRPAPIETAPADVKAAVYAALPAVFPLTDADRKHLLMVRHVPEENLKDYFSFPKEYDDELYKKVFLYVADRICRLKYGIGLDSITANRQPDDKEKLAAIQIHMDRFNKFYHIVPGMYYDKKRGRGSYAYMSYSGIGMLYRDLDGRTVGVKVRKHRAVKGEARYVWWASSSMIGKKGIWGGATSGSPGGVLFPKNREGADIAITEGRFKAEQLALAGYIAVYADSVSTWGSIIPYVKTLKEGRRRICIAFDADEMNNTAVSRQLAALARAIRRMDLTPVVMAWPLSLGKGFDDFYIKMGEEHYREHLTECSEDALAAAQKEALAATLQAWGVSSEADVAEEMRPDFKAVLQREVEKRLGIK